ncbi:MAG: hypothetical protein SOY46_09665 [Butyrivibrio crossotus]|nr:hypothetical protein [Butyrivibrio crossotus]
MTTENIIITGLTGDDIHIFREGKEFASYQRNNKTGFDMTDKEADMIIGYMEGHGYHIGIKENALMKGDYVDTENEVHWETISMDDLIDLVCEWNYEIILDNEYYFKQSGIDKRTQEAQAEYDRLKSDKSVLDRLFENTCYGRDVETLANQIAGELISVLSSEIPDEKAKDTIITNVAETIGSYVHSGKSR